jgi:DNA (cytosine-5)-methyltransferase 1
VVLHKERKIVQRKIRRGTQAAEHNKTVGDKNKRQIMIEQIDIYDMLGNDGQQFKPVKSTDWKWTMANDYPKEKNGLKVFSCFAGGGGSTMGYKLAGCEVIGCCEIDKKMNDVYVKNHNPKHNFLMDIRDFNKTPNKQLPEELFNLDILDGSPPCTTFSMAGKREQNWGKKKKFREGQVEQVLDDLSFVFIETVQKLKPKCVIMENVEGLIKGEAWGYVQKIYKQLNDIGYQVKHWLLKGEQMGVPQTRHRVFFIALRNDIDYDLNDVDMGFNYEPVPYHKIKDGKYIKMNPETQTYKTLCKAMRGDKDICDVYRRLGERERGFGDKIVWDDEIIPTVTARAGFMSGDNKARISKMDIVHAQTFPEDYDFDGAPYGYICGMSVPPIMIKRIVTRLIESGLLKQIKQASNI